MYDYVVSINEVGRGQIDQVGGKGANLGELIKSGIPVPPGFVVTTSSFKQFIEDNDIKDQIEQIILQTDVDDSLSLTESSSKIKKIILSSKVPSEIERKIIENYQKLITKRAGEVIDSNTASASSSAAGTAAAAEEDLLPLVAIRSSATAEDLPNASFAGQQSSFLNVKNELELMESIRKCWASLYEPRAIFYRFKNKISKVSIAVIVQKMIESDKSGIMFTVDPTTGENTILIEATWGLGESIVGGEISPDSYHVSKQKIKEKAIIDNAITDIKIAQKTKIIAFDTTSKTTITYDSPPDKINAQVLTKEQILKLASYGLMIEKYYDDQPQDIEFAIDKSENIFFVQSRPITTKADNKNKIDIIDKNQLIKGIGASPGTAVGKVKIIKTKDSIKNIEKGDIIVTAMTSPDLVPSMNKSSAIITDLGGRTCHAAIVSREMGIPAIVGAQNATIILQDNQVITVDAFNGIVYDGVVDLSSDTSISGYQKPSGVESGSGSSDSIKTKIKINLAFFKNIEEIEPKVEGVGLLRLEHMIAQYGTHPAKLMRDNRLDDYIQMLMDGIRPIAKIFNPKPVWVRTLDARTDEFRNLVGGEEEPHESNPMLGWHGIRRSLDEPALLKAELNAIKKLHDEGFTNLYVMLPFVISVEEVQKSKEICREISSTLENKIGIMVETPAAILIIEELCKEGISFVSFGTNDLTQLILGIDRNNERLSRLSSVFHPAVLKSMKMVIEVCNRLGVETSICGESGSQSEMAQILVRYGIKSISCNRDAIDLIRTTIFEEEQRMMKS